MKWMGQSGAFGACVLLLAGCAAAQRESFIQQEVGEYVYERPASEVWPHAKALLEEEGYSYKEAPNGFLLATEWQEEMSGSKIAASFTRYLVEAVPLGPSRSRIRFLRNTMTMGGGPGVVEGKRHVQDARAYAQGHFLGGTRTAAGSRDLRMEWLLMRRAAPDDAAELQTVAEQRYH